MIRSSRKLFPLKSTHDCLLTLDLVVPVVAHFDLSDFNVASSSSILQLMVIYRYIGRRRDIT